MSWFHLLFLQHVICFKGFQIHLSLIIHCQHIQTTRQDKLSNETERNFKQNTINVLVNGSLVTYGGLQEDLLKWKDALYHKFHTSFVSELPPQPTSFTNKKRIFFSSFAIPSYTKTVSISVYPNNFEKNQEYVYLMKNNNNYT